MYCAYQDSVHYGLPKSGTSYCTKSSGFKLPISYHFISKSNLRYFSWLRLKTARAKTKRRKFLKLCYFCELLASLLLSLPEGIPKKAFITPLLATKCFQKRFSGQYWKQMHICVRVHVYIYVLPAFIRMSLLTNYHTIPYIIFLVFLILGAWFLVI